MGKKIRTYLRRPDRTPWYYASVLAYAVDRLREASANGKGIRLSAEEVRALDYSVIREDGGVDTACFREHAFGEEASP